MSCTAERSIPKLFTIFIVLLCKFDSNSNSNSNSRIFDRFPNCISIIVKLSEFELQNSRIDLGL